MEALLHKKTIIIDAVIFSCLFFITAWASLYLAQNPKVITNISIANTLGIVLLLRHKLADWPLPIMGIAVANFLAFRIVGSDDISSSYFTLINLAEIVLTVCILIRCQIVEYFDKKIKSAYILIFTVFLIAPAMSATLGTLLLESKKTLYFWLHWYVGNGICLTVFLPIALCLMRAMGKELTRRNSLFLLQWIIMSIAIILPTVFYLPHPFIFIVVPLLIVAVRSSVFVTIFVSCLNVFIIFSLYNAQFFAPQYVSIFHQNYFVYYPTILIFVLPYLLAVYMAISKKIKQQLEMSESQFRSVMECTSIGIALVSLDGYWFMVNEALCRMFGYTKDEFKKLTIDDLTYPDDLPMSLEKLEELKSRKIDTFALDKRYLCKNGSIIWAHLTVTLVSNPDLSPKHYIAVIEEITEKKKIELANVALTNQLFDEKEHLKILLTSIVDSVIATDEKGLITFMNPEAEKITGWTFIKAKGLPSEHVLRLINKDSNKALENPIFSCLRSMHTPITLQDALLISKTRKKYDIQYAVSLLKNKDKKIMGAEIIFQNVTQAKSMQKALSYNATHDSLTGILNRREFEKAINQALLNVDLKGMQYILCYLDLDYFKIINDTAGHAAGDALLKEISALLFQRLRKVDVLARLGGDEFGILLLNCSLSSGKKIIQELINLINSIRFSWKNTYYRVGVSIGMVLLDDNKLSAGELLSEADIACYSAKAAGRNQLFVYQAEEAESMEHHRHILMASKLHQVIEDRRIILYVQKIVSRQLEFDTSQHFEILMRMLSEDNELIPASAFIPIAERFDLMANIDRWVLTQILSHYQHELSRLENGFFSINLSANSLNDSSLLPFLVSLIKKSVLRPKQLCFEITETAAMTHMTKTIKIVDKLRGMGCKVALDDFGVGLSSFSYIKNFSVDFIKIDGSFVKNILSQEVDRTIVQTINDMAHRLGMETIAEYVENEKILNMISEMGVDYVQGFAIGKPEPLSNLIEHK